MKIGRILALAGLGALAYREYQKMSSEDKKAINDKIDTAKQNLSNLGSKLRSKTTETLDKVESSAKELQEKAREQVNAYN